MKIVVIGSNSFSGAWFADLCLEQGLDTICVSRSAEYDDVYLPYKLNARAGHQFHQYDLNHDGTEIAALIEKEKATHVVNFAAQGMVGQSWDNPRDWFMTNTLGHISLHNAIKDFDFLKKYTHISTPEVYGNCTGTVLENFNYNPSTPYATSKAACDLSLMTFFTNYSFPVVFTRAANVYGPCQALYRIIPRTILAIRSGEKLPLHGGGHSVRAFIHIKDVARATLEITQKAPPGEIYHLSNDRFISIRDLVKMICDKMGADFDEVVEITDDRPGKDHAYTLSSEKVRSEFGWKEDISLDEGLAETIGWVERNYETLRAHPDYYVHKA